MNKILIVGHQNSHYKKLEEILQLCGMASAGLSHHYQMTPQQINQKIVQATNSKPSYTRAITHHKNNKTKVVPKSNTVVIADKYAQKTPKKMWDNLVFDLILANADKPLWGWSDSEAIKLLEYWAQFDEEIAFVLTYDRPYFLLESAISSMAIDDLTESTFDELLGDWLAYNQALLDFYKKYPERCILVNGEQVIRSAPSYVDSVAQKIEWQFDVIDGSQLQVCANEQLGISEIAAFFIDKLLTNKNNVATMLDMLQETANMPWVHMPSARTDLDLLKSVLKEKSELETAKEKLIANQDAYLQKEQNWQKQLSQAQQSHDHDKDKESLDGKNERLKSIEQENELLITQLHQVQEELEKYYRENQNNQDKLKNATQEIQSVKKTAEEQKKQAESLNQAKQKAEQIANEHKKQVEQLSKAKQQLEKQINEYQQQAQKTSKGVQQENELLITQLHQVQEELERYYLENQRLKSAQETPKPAKPVYYGAADRVKQDLPYRLGATMVSHSKSTKDLAKLPLALAQEYRAFQKQQSTQGELPPVEEYQDSYEAEKVKKHLSYKLGKTLVDSVKSPKNVLDLPVKLGREIVGFKGGNYRS